MSLRVLCRYLVLIGGLLGFHAMAIGAPELARREGPGLAERLDGLYRFESFTLDSRDAERHYRVYLGIPRSSGRSASGHPVLYLLDGNAVEDDLERADLEPLAELPVLVMLGYATEQRFEVESRAFDYTPGPPLRDVEGPRAGGGAEAFLRLLVDQVKPEVERRVMIDASRQTLWGHSFGGLFALFVLSHAPETFQQYAVADPALWWADGALFRQMQQQVSAQAAGRHLLVMRAGAEARRPVLSEEQKKRLEERQRATQSVPSDAALVLLRHLVATAAVQGHYREYPGLSHGPLFRASVLPALRMAVGHWED